MRRTEREWLATLPLIGDLRSSTVQRLDRALERGGRIQGFGSGGGLRVIRIEQNRGADLIGYGEHPSVERALRRAAAEAAGKKSDPKRLEYLTGSPECTSQVDAWLRYGNTFLLRFIGGLVEARFFGYSDMEAPEGMQDRVIATLVPEEFEQRGCRFRMTPIRFANGEPGVSIAVVSLPEGMPHHRAFMWRSMRRGTGAGFLAAIAAALGSEDIEIADGFYEKARDYLEPESAGYLPSRS